MFSNFHRCMKVLDLFLSVSTVTYSTRQLFVKSLSGLANAFFRQAVSAGAEIVDLSLLLARHAVFAHCVHVRSSHIQVRHNKEHKSSFNTCTLTLIERELLRSIPNKKLGLPQPIPMKMLPPPAQNARRPSSRSKSSNRSTVTCVRRTFGETCKG